MLTENGLEIDVEQVHEVLRHADVLTIAFSLFPERLLFDVRTNEQEGPLAAIVEPVASVQERYLWLGKHRGHFGAPQAFSFFMWPHTVRSLIDRDVLAPMRDRLAALSPEAPAVFEKLLSTLGQREREAMAEAINGEGQWRPLWEQVR